MLGATSSSSWVLIILGTALFCLATYRAIIDRKDPRRIILWGATHDLGVAIMALGALNSLSLLGVWLFVLYQAAVRLLSWFSLRNLEEGFYKGGANQPSQKKCFCRSPFSVLELTGVGRAFPWAGAMFTLGLLGAVGGSPFLVPEGRAFMVSGLIENAQFGTISGLVFFSLCSTVFIWLYVEAITKICLHKLPENAPKLSSINGGAGFWTIGFGVLVAVLGLFRNPVTDILGGIFSVEIAHSPVHWSWYVYYIGAFATGFAYLCSFRWASELGTLFFALGFAAVCISPAGPLANFFLFIIALIGLLVAIYSISYIHDDRKGWYWFFLLLTFGSMAALVSTPNVAALYGYWELMTYASFFLVAHEANKSAFAAAIKYYVMCAGGAVFMLPGLMALGIFALEPGMAYQLPFWLKSGIILCLAGFGVKAGLVPLHSWLPEAHPAAPSSVSAPLSGVITKMGIFGLISVIIIGVGSAQNDLPGLFGLTWFGTWLALMAAATLIYGEIMALCQTDIKKMLAYSTMGQIGEIALVLSLGTWLATAGALWHVFNHAIMKDLLFLAAGALIMRAGSRQLSDLKGLGQQMPFTVACMAAGLISIMGLPPFGAFYSKFLMIQASVNAGHIWVAVLLLAGALAGAIYYTRILKTLVLEPRPADAPQVQDAPFTMKLPLAILAGLSLLFGFAPQLLMPIILPVASMCYAIPANAGQIMTAMSVNWPIYVIFPVIGAILPAIFYGRPRMAGWTSVAVLLVSALLVIIFGRQLDTLSFCFALLVPLIGALNMAYAVGYMSHSHSQWRFYCAFTCMCGGLIGMAASQYLLSFFLFWEIMSSWALYLAIAHEGMRREMQEAFKYFIFNLFGAGFIFVGLCVTGPLAPMNASALGSLFGNVSPNMAWLGIALLATGFVLKAAQLPFRIDWQMHPALAPTPVSGYISSVLLKSAIIGLIKLFMLLGGGLVIAGILTRFRLDTVMTVVMWIGGITIVMAAIQALRSNGLKLIFIYSTVSQLGYMVLAVACGTALGYAGGMLHLINHVFFKDLLFLVCGAVMFVTHKETLHDLGGIGRKMPFTLLMFAIGGLSVVGVPPTSGFSSKWIIYQALMQAGQPLLALLSLVGSVLTLAYIAKFMHAAFLGQPADDLDQVREAPLVMRIPMALLAAGCILTGIFPGLALYPINNILAQYGVRPLEVAISGLVAGPGAWNATGIFCMMALAFAGGAWFIKHFTRLREIDVHTCGLPTNVATSRMNPASIYGDIVRLLSGNDSAKENR